MTDPKLVEEKQEINSEVRTAGSSTNSEVRSVGSPLNSVLESRNEISSPQAAAEDPLSEKNGPQSPIINVINDGIVNDDSATNAEYELQNHDDLVRKAQEEIEREIKARHPFLTPMLPLKSLDVEFASDEVYKQKLQDLLTRYRAIRKTRPDGNCFFRCFGFAYFESLINDKKELDRFKKIAQDSKDQLVSMGFNSFTVEDFHDTFMSVLNGLTQGVEHLEQAFNDDGKSEYLVVYWRLLTSCYLRKEEEFYQNFLEGYATVKDFCEHEVEPMYRESDHIHIIALTSFLNVGVRVNYMDRGGADGKVNAHDFPEGPQPPRIHLLYRPGHYDVLYPNQQDLNPSSPGVNSPSSNGVAE